jgi:inosine-uridine nucleoside N-ribohydrolase
MKPVNVIFDTDPGIDDAMAILLLHALPSINVQAISIFVNASACPTPSTKGLA